MELQEWYSYSYILISLESSLIEGNNKLRKPQIEAYLRIQSHFKSDPDKEALVFLPTGTGKSGLIAIAPYGICDGRLLIATPGNVTKKSIAKTIEALDENFWINNNVFFNIEDNPVLVSFENGRLNSTYLFDPFASMLLQQHAFFCYHDSLFVAASSCQSIPRWSATNIQVSS
jgi:hypothetical protein